MPIRRFRPPAAHNPHLTDVPIYHWCVSCVLGIMCRRAGAGATGGGTRLHLAHICIRWRRGMGGGRGRRQWSASRSAHDKTAVTDDERTLARPPVSIPQHKMCRCAPPAEAGLRCADEFLIFFLIGRIPIFAWAHMPFRVPRRRRYRTQCMYSSLCAAFDAPLKLRKWMRRARERERRSLFT